MAHCVIVQPRALRDMQKIYEWLAARSLNGARNWYEAFSDAVASLRNNPERRPIAEESPVKGREVRQLFFRTRQGRPYRLLFTLTQEEVHVLHVRGPGQPPLGPEL